LFLTFCAWYALWFLLRNLYCYIKTYELPRC